MSVAPHQCPYVSDATQKEAQRHAHAGLTERDPVPIARGELTQRKRSDDQRGRLRAGVATRRDDHGKEEDERQDLIERTLIMTKGRAGEKLADEEKTEPGATA